MLSFFLYLFLYLAVFIFGLIIGSFLNALIYRFEIGELRKSNFLTGRSYCPNCHHELSWQDLVPILSFFLLQRQCRYCHKKISWQYPLVEAATAILFVLVFNYQFPEVIRFPFFGPQNLLAAGYWMTITSFLIVIFVYDLKHYIIPDKIIYPAIGISFIFDNFNSYFAGNQSLLNFFSAAIAASLFFILIVILTAGKGMGIGDVKLVFLMGLILGWPAIFPALFSAFFIGAIIGVALIALGRKKMSSEVPFGPFLITGTYLSLFWGERMVSWYMNLLL